MVDKSYSDAQKLAAVERAIEVVRAAARSAGTSARFPGSDYHETHGALRAVAVDIRTRMEIDR